MKNLKIGTKLLVTFMLIIVLFCITVVTSIRGLQMNAEKYSDFYNVGYQITNRIMSMRRGLQIVVKDLSFYTITDDEDKRESYMADIRKELDKLEEDSEWVFANFSDETELMNAFADSLTEAVTLQETVLEIAQTDNKAAQTLLLDEYQPLIDETVNMLIQISNAAEKNAEEDYLDTVSMQKTLVFEQLGLAGVALIITLILSIYLTRLITRPLRELEGAANKIVGGEFDINITYRSRDELGSLAQAFKNMTVILAAVISDASRLLREMADGNFDVRTEAEQHYVGDFGNLLLSIRKLNRDLSSTLGQINISANEVSAGSGQVSDGAQALSQGATEQAAAVEELAATISDISYQVKDTAENAIEAKEQSDTAGDDMEECNQYMREMITAMEEITRTSNEIGKIIKTIEDIAFQTNLLAFNAAVEASRAGVNGKGFAVVADEVRNLAGKSSEASKDTAELIENSIKAVKRGMEIADSTAQALTKVVDKVRTAASKVDMIAEAAEREAGAVEQVTTGVNQISSVVQTNSATAVESAAASEELSSQADMLRNLVAKFTLRQEYAMGAQSNGAGRSGGFIDLN